MAKRKRLTPLDPGLSQSLEAGLETKSAASGIPPIAHVAGGAATASAIEEVSRELRSAREEGRLIQALPLDRIEAGFLVRDRMEAEADALETLKSSLRARGQQTPVEVTELGQGRYGLISGWRRLMALRALHGETGEARFGTVLALLRRPSDSSQAYLAMVEENEIREGLSYYERARIAARAAEAGAFETPRDAVRALFTAASRAKRSKINSFLSIYEALDGALHHPRAIPERLGLALAKALADTPGLDADLAAQLSRLDSPTAEREIGVLTAASAPPRANRPEKPRPAKPAISRPAPGLRAERSEGRLVLTGAPLDDGLADRILAWLESGEAI